MLDSDFLRLGGSKRKVEIDLGALREVNATRAEEILHAESTQARNAHVVPGVQDTYTLFTKTSLVGMGGFGRVFGGVDARGDGVVLKELRRVPYHGREKNKTPACSDRAINREWRVARLLGERLAPTAGSCTPTRAYIVMPPAHSTAHDAAAELRRLPDRSAAWKNTALLTRLLRDAGAHLQRIHAKGYVHNDLKPNNIFLVAADGSRDACFEIGDFGNSFHFKGGEIREPNVYFGAPERVLGELGPGETFAQSFERMAKADIFSLGILCVLLVVGEEQTERLLPKALTADEPSAMCATYAAFERTRQGIGADVLDADSSGAGGPAACGLHAKPAQAVDNNPSGAADFMAAWDEAWARIEEDAAPYAALLKSMVHANPDARPSAAEVAAFAQVQVAHDPAQYRDLYALATEPLSHVEDAVSLSRRWWMAGIKQGTLTPPEGSNFDAQGFAHKRRYDIARFVGSLERQRGQALQNLPLEAATVYHQWLLDNLGFA